MLHYPIQTYRGNIIDERNVKISLKLYTPCLNYLRLASPFNPEIILFDF